MPNHCMNRLIVTGPKKRIAWMQAAVQGTTCFDCNAIIPMPFELRCHSAPAHNENEKKFQEKYGAKDWHEWAVRNWGTKWGAYQLDGWSEVFDQYSDDEDLGTAHLHFDTAWSPFLPVMKKLASHFPELRFELSYLEPGMCFAGHHVWDGGKEVETEMSENPDDELYQRIAYDDFGWKEEEDE